MADEKLQGELIDVDVEKIKPNIWNPNVMKDEQFNRLTREIKDIGFVDPIQVVALKDGTFRIVNCEHRYEAAKILDYKTVPCVVLKGRKWTDEDLQKFVSVRLNMIRGELNPEKFLNLYNEMMEKYGDEALRDLMGFTDKGKWNALTKSVKESLQAMGLPPEILKDYDSAVEEIKTVDDLSLILNTLFTKYGKSLASDFMIFSYLESDSKILYVKAEKDVYDVYEKLAKKAEKEDRKFNDILRRMAELYKESGEKNLTSE